MQITVAGASKTYSEKDGQVLKGINLEIPGGSFLALMGRSGSGKSTLLNILAGITAPSAGEVYYDDDVIWNQDDDARSQSRRSHTATVFQDFNLFDFFDRRGEYPPGRPPCRHPDPR